MGDVNFTMTSDDKDAQKAFDRQQREIAKLKEKVAELGKTSRKSADEGKKAVEGQSESLAKMAVNLVSVGSAVGMVSGAYEQWHQRMRAIAQESNKFHGELLKNLNAAGDLASGAKIKAAIRSVPGATQQESMDAFHAVSGSSPGSDLDRRLAIGKHVARLAPISDVTATGGFAGELGEMMPGTKPEDVVDLAAKVMDQSGADAGKLGSAGFLRGAKMLSDASGVDMNTALATGAHGMGQNMDPRFMEAMAVAIQSRGDNITKGGKLTADQKIKNKFGAMSQGDAFNALLDPAMQRAIMGDRAGTRNAQLDRATIDKMAADQRSAMAGDEVGARLGLAAKDDPATFAQRGADLRLEKSKQAVEEKTRAEEVARTDREAAIVGMDPLNAEKFKRISQGVEFVGGGAELGNQLAADSPSFGAIGSGGAMAPVVAGLEKIYRVMVDKKPAPGRPE